MLEKWQSELTGCVRSLEQLEKHLPVRNREKMRSVIAGMRLSITPHTLRLIDFDDPEDPLLLMSVPQERELAFAPEETDDPIGDEARSPVPFLTHRYPDRVLVYATYFCSLFCRFCFRRYKTGSASRGPAKADVDGILAYIRGHEEIQEVILSGGDPLTLVDPLIDGWLGRLRAIPTVRRIRIHTRVPVNLPSRITDGLIDVFRTHMDATHPLYIVTHFNHPREIAAENIAAVARLADAGIVVRNQGPLLKGVNDDPEILAELFRKLADIRVVPYYLHQLDLAKGTDHFRVPMERGIALMRAVQGNVSGIALPRYMLDLPGGKGKIPVCHAYAIKKNGRTWSVESPFGERSEYREPERP